MKLINLLAAAALLAKPIQGQLLRGILDKVDLGFFHHDEQVRSTLISDSSTRAWITK